MPTATQNRTAVVPTNAEIRLLGIIGEVRFGVWSSAPSGWKFCNGETIGDVGSGADHENSGYEALFDYLKEGWDNAGTEVWGDGDTVKLPNNQGIGITGAGTQSINGRAKGGDSLGDIVEDAMQGHYHSGNSNTRATNGGSASDTTLQQGDNTLLTSPYAPGILSPSTDGTNGTPRTGAETKMSSVVYNFIICCE